MTGISPIYYVPQDATGSFTSRRVLVVNPDGSINISGTPTGSITVVPKPVAAINQEGKINVGAAKTGIIAANASRAFAIFVNDSDEDIYLSLGDAAAMNEGIRLNAAGGWYEINSSNLYTGSVTAICSSGTKNLTYSEG